MLIAFKRGQGSIVIRVKILDSSVATGAGKTGLAYNTSGLKISTIADNESSPTSYTVAGSTIEDITTLGTFAAPTATKCRFKEVSSSSHPGVYELQIADARFAVSSAKSLLISISGATNAAECDVCIPLVDLDPYGNSNAHTFAALTVTGSFTISDGLIINRSSSNTSAIVITGNGTGHGVSITSGSGATGNGVNIVSASTNGNGVNYAGTGTGDGVKATAGATGRGIHAIGGATSGSGIKIEGTAGNAAGLELAGQGSASGLESTGGATGHGIKARGGATSGDGINAAATTLGDGIDIAGAGSAGVGLKIAAGSNAAGISVTGAGSGAGVTITAGATGVGLSIATTAGDGLSITPTAGHAIVATANGTSKHGLVITGGTAGTSDGVKAVAGTGGVPIRGDITGNITGNLSGTIGVNHTGTAQAGGASTITLASGASASDNWYNGCEVSIESGTGAIQTRTITAYNGTSKVATVDRAWVTSPDNTSVYTVVKSNAPKLSSALGVTTSDADVMLSTFISDVSPSASQFKGDTSGLSSSDDIYNGAWCAFTSGVNVGLWRKISDYVGSTRQLKFSGTGTDADAPFPNAPSNGDTFKIGGRA